MPITPTYPGVYIEELPSNVHTIVGVSTSVTAFVGYTKRGPADQPVHVFSFGDFQRAFGDLDPDSPLTYAVQQFFVNGGSEAWIVRTAVGASPASVTLGNTAGNPVLVLTAASSGAWGNTLQITVDDGTTNPNSLFNLTVTEFVVSGGTLVPGTSESYLNLSMNSASPNFAKDVVNYSSQLVSADLAPGLPATVAGTSLGGSEVPSGLTLNAGGRLALSLNGQPPVELVLLADATGPTGANNIVDGITNAFPAAGLGPTDLTVMASGGGGHKHILLTSGTADERSSVHVLPASVDDIAPALGLGVQNGGTEIDGSAGRNPSPTGTVGQALTQSLGGPVDTAFDTSVNPVTVDVAVNVQGTAVNIAGLTLLAVHATFSTKEELRAGVQAMLQGAALANPTVKTELAGATVALVADQLVITAGGRPDTTIALAGPRRGQIGFAGNTQSQNVAAYSPSTADRTPELAQRAATLGADGTPPVISSDVIGDESRQDRHLRAQARRPVQPARAARRRRRDRQRRCSARR